ncbi:MAG: type I-E CRISPR-associated protein Cas5/CasD [Chloroflexi bacterium]|nr:type I-E CRISPR-associated protein Cas5/CasD [Chloroflexota bacterium]
MSTLLLRLAGPMQSWGTQSRFSVRDTGQEPSKSGVIGLVAAALGRPRDQDIRDLAVLRMGVRVDQEGRALKDFHTALNVIRADGSRSNDAVISNRYYLADANFLVGLETEDDALLDQIHHAVANPYWPLCLGRKAFPIGVPVFIPGGLQRESNLENTLSTFPIESRLLNQRFRVRLVMEQAAQTGVARMDQPVSFHPRRYANRYVKTQWLEATQMTTEEE